MIFVSGAGGFLASHILQQGIENKIQISCQYRSLRPRSYLYGTKDQFKSYQLDFAKDTLPNEIFNHVSVVINTMGNTTSQNQEQIECDNLLATQKLYLAAAHAGAKHWVQVSSIAAICNGTAEMVSLDKITAPRNTAYASAKNNCDLWLQDQTAIPKLTIVYPTYMLGAWDSKPSSGGVLIGMRLKKITKFIEGKKNFVAARDVAKGIWRLVNSGTTGKIILGGENYLISDFVGTALNVMGMPNTGFSVFQKDAPQLKELTQNETTFINEFCQSSAVESNWNIKTNLSDVLNETFLYFKESKIIF